MQFKTLFATSLLAGFALAGPYARPQDAAASSTDTAMSPAQTVPSAQLCTGMKTWVVNVSDASNALTFSPNNVQAAIGECVQYQFYGKNHSVVQADFATPCQPTKNQTGAFYSGFMPVTATTQGKLIFTVKVTDTKPKWFYCSQAMHCQSGMVGAINAPTTGNTVAGFAAAAAMASSNVSPGGTVEGGTATSASGSAAAGSAATATSSAGAISSGAAAPQLLGAARTSAWGMGLSAMAAFLFF